ncbi:Molybdopterin molybdenumtransferase [Kingella potus]|uniref:Molybdopterin molybdenumtransferase n=2 Tax=Kingella potus TaxID=265175 RepID=A0A377R461_9NEIS|nr:gephyrin-like molybdotransferase Glp [Kingella potus]STR03123.1 Molybdopterin molybdenumtransferase [Kingella potus]
MALTSVQELQTLIHDKIAARCRLPETETVPAVAAVGRILAEDIVSTVNLPPADISAMDGYALQSASAAGSEWVVAGESVAGGAFSGCLLDGACVRIMTGAVVPDDCNTVIVQENVAFSDGIIRLEKDAAEGANIRRKGEEIAAGDTVLTAGRILREADIMLLAALGHAEVPVRRKIRVALLSSGNELCEPGEPNNGRTDQIYDSNRAMLAARLSGLPVEIIDFKQVGDDLEDVLHVFDEVIRAADVLITTGGVSVGDYDFMRTAVERVGSVHHYKVGLKPGKPFVFGRMMDTWFFGLPGNPVSGFVGFDIFLKAALWQLCGASDIPQPLRFTATLSEPVTKNHSRMDIQRGIIEQQPDGTWLARPCGKQDSHRILQVSRANAYLVLPAESGPLDAGESVTVQPFDGAFL